MSWWHREIVLEWICTLAFQKETIVSLENSCNKKLLNVQHFFHVIRVGIFYRICFYEIILYIFFFHCRENVK